MIQKSFPVLWYCTYCSKTQTSERVHEWITAQNREPEDLYQEAGN